MVRVASSRRLPLLVMVALVVFMFWRPLFGGGTLVPHDQVASYAPFAAEQVDALTVEVAPAGSVGVHGYWANVGESTRTGTLSWWDPTVAGGLPTLRNGFPIFNLAYLVVPAWFAPGLVGALSLLAAMVGMFGFMRSRKRSSAAALTSAVGYGFSGFIVVWIGWPHAAAAALVPWLFWAVDGCLCRPRRRAIASIGLAIAALLWTGSFVVALWATLGALAWRIGSGANAQQRRDVWRLASRGVALGVALSAPYLVSSIEYWRWADTANLSTGKNTSAPIATSLTSVLPSAWGNDALGSPWFGGSSFQLANVHVGLVIVMLAVVGATTAWRSIDRATLMLSGVGLFAFGVAFVGGPFSKVSNLFTFSAGEATHARVLLVLVVGVLAGDGVHAMTNSASSLSDLRQLVRASTRTALILGLVAVPALWQLMDASRAAGAVRSTLADATVPVLAAVGALLLLRQLQQRVLDPKAVGAALVAVVAFEVLFFATPIPTVTSRHERIHETAGHRTVRDLLAESTRIGAPGQTFFAGTNAAFGMDDIGGPGLRSGAGTALAQSLSVQGGSPPDLGIARAAGVGVWAQLDTSQPPGRLVEPAVPASRVDPALQPRVGHTRAPDGGLRAIVFDLERLSDAEVEVQLRGVGIDLFRRLSVGAGDESVSVAFEGEGLEAGADIAVTVRIEAEPGTTSLGVDERGEAVIGVVGGDDFSHLLLRDGLALTVINDASLVRVAGAAVVEHDLGQVVALLSHRGGLDSPAIVSLDVGLPSEPDGGNHRILDSKVQAGRVVARVEQSTDGLVVVAINDYPGWQATVDGVPADVVRADGAFMGVLVPAGAHVIELSYSPRLIRSTALIVLFAALLTLWLCLGGRSEDPSLHHEAGSVQRRG